jgi:hypothetical protein
MPYAAMALRNELLERTIGVIYRAGNRVNESILSCALT